MQHRVVQKAGKDGEFEIAFLSRVECGEMMEDRNAERKRVESEVSEKGQEKGSKKS